MARQRGILKFEGMLGEICFYKSKFGLIARQKSSLDARRIKQDAAFVRTMENANEFALAAKAGKLLRSAAAHLSETAGRRATMNKLNQLMLMIKQLDTVSVRGKRHPGIALQTGEAKALLNGFDFNTLARQNQVLLRSFEVDTGSGNLVMDSISMSRDVYFPPGATHIELRGCFLQIDFLQSTYTFTDTNSLVLPKDYAGDSIELTAPDLPIGGGILLCLCHTRFFQQLNSSLLPLNNETFETLKVIAT